MRPGSSMLHILESPLNRSLVDGAQVTACYGPFNGVLRSDMAYRSLPERIIWISIDQQRSSEVSIRHKSLARDRQLSKIRILFRN